MNLSLYPVLMLALVWSTFIFPHPVIVAIVWVTSSYAVFLNDHILQAQVT